MSVRFRIDSTVFVLSVQDEAKGDGNKSDKGVFSHKNPGASAATTPGMNIRLKKGN